MNDVLTLREHLECLGGLIHDQGGVGHQDLLCQDLDWVLCVADYVLHPVYEQLSLMSVVEILIIDEVRLNQHLLEDRIILCGCRDLAHGEYLLMCGLIRDEGVEEAQTEQGNLIVRLFLNEGDDHRPEQELYYPGMLLRYTPQLSAITYCPWSRSTWP